MDVKVDVKMDDHQMDDRRDSGLKEASPVNGDKRDGREPSVPSPVTATKSPKRQGDEETANDADLSPPPDSSSVSSVNPDMLGDEIVVGTRANGNKPSPQRIASEGDGEAVEGEKPASHYPKRKRASLYSDLGEDKMEPGILEDAEDAEASRLGGKQRHGLAGAKNVVLGYWRDSHVPSLKGKHAVIGFMDVRDRLRTRIQNVTRDGTLINTRLFPVPPGPGGSWVTFERVVFEPHLVGLDHHEVKEYVKIRTDCPPDASLEAREKAEKAAVEEARRRLEANPPPDTAQPTTIAYGIDIPETSLSRPEAKRRRVNNAVGTMAEQRPALIPQQPQPQTPIPQTQPQVPSLDNLAGKRPTRILVGCWAKSTPEDPRDKHAVYGILGANDMFRVKLVRETMDGRFLEGNFPNGAGALWIQYEDVLFLPHLRSLSRPEMKEYVRVRQFQLDNGETEEERRANEDTAVYEAQVRATAANRNHVPGSELALRQSAPADRERDDGQDSTRSEPPAGGHELRHARREVLPRNEGPQSRLPFPEADIRQGSRPPSIDPLERVQGLATREVARMEAVQLRNDRHEASRAAIMQTLDPMESRRQFQEHRDRMQQVWTNQEQNRIRASSERGNSDDSKVYMGIKYERRQNGPFVGKLVSQGTIISIDGEDYVEYRVLTKPTFF